MAQSIVVANVDEFSNGNPACPSEQTMDHTRPYRETDVVSCMAISRIPIIWFVKAARWKFRSRFHIKQTLRRLSADTIHNDDALVNSLLSIQTYT